jgi:glucose/arabinose dehydrogenase
MALRAPKNDDAWYIVERSGKVWRYDGTDREMIIDISGEVSTDAEQGMYDFAISPDERYAYIHFTGVEKPYGDSHVREYEWTGSDVAGEGREVLVVEDPYPHHNGGQMEFGPDGFLYVAIGDGGTKELKQLENNGDPHNYGSSNDDLLGGILRIDPRPSDGKDYTIPKGNPFVDEKGRDEVWAYGLRNPWRFSFDKQTGDLWVPDVGHRFSEEINVQPADSKGGENYGWSSLEAALPYKGDDPPKGHVLPVYAYPHRGGPCAIIGGYVYRGTKIPSLRGSYVFGDFCTGTLQAIRLRDGEVVSHRYLGIDVEQLVSLAQDRDGELFALSYTKGISRIVPRG